MENLYEHQYERDNMYYSKFIFVHDDTFGRCFHNKQEIIDYIRETNLDFEIDIISTTRNGYINIFLLTIYNEQPIEDVIQFANEHELWNILNIDDCKYYDPTSCDFNLYKKGENL